LRGIEADQALQTGGTGFYVWRLFAAIADSTHMSAITKTGRRGGTPRRMLRGNPRLTEERHDPYRSETKLRGPVCCSQCGATYLRGRWRWERLRPAPPATATCPACRRINDRYPAGELHLTGDFVLAHADEIVNLIRNVEKNESADHALHRIIDLKRSGAEITVTTTDLHLPRRIGHALEDAWHGTLDTHYDEAGYFTLVKWRRDS
jgi:hypothetical protein